MREVCVFRLPERATRRSIEVHMATAIFSAECTFGVPRVRISAAYRILPGKPDCVIDTGSEVGRHIAQVFTGCMVREFGESGFQVERRAGLSDPEGASDAARQPAICGMGGGA
jgi:hypothetical protein